MRLILLLATVMTAMVAAPSPAQQPGCAPDGPCTVRMSAVQLLRTAEKLVLERKFDEARPMIAALENAPELTMERRFLEGYVAVETGDLDTAIADFRAILNDHPKQTRVRLELARALMMKGQTQSADHHLRLAQEDEDLPPEIAATIRSTRGVIRDRRTWYFNLDVGIAPDSNINNATRLDRIDTIYQDVQVELNGDAKARSGVGMMTGFSGGFRFRMNKQLAMLIDADGLFSNYKGKDADDMTGQLAIGPELKLDPKTTVSVQALGAQRWFGGEMALRQFGIKASAQRFLDSGQRIGLLLDARKTHSGFSEAYDGWQLGAYASYERVVSRSMVASVTLFGRRDELESDSYSNTEAGLNLGIGGELPLGINAGFSAGLSYAWYDEALMPWSFDKRHDLRANGRAYVGLRSIRVLGFSPSLTYSYAGIASNYDFYQTGRHRLRFNLARYF